MCRPLVLLATLAFAPHFGIAAEPAPKTPAELHRAALAAFQREDYPSAIAGWEAALDLRPDSPRYLFNLAIARSSATQTDAALAALRQLAAFGIVVPVAQSPAFASLRERPEFEEILRVIAANREPRGQATVMLELPGATGIVEGLAHRDSTGEFFFGDVHHRCVWRRSADGQLSRFSSPDDALPGVFDLAIDEPRQLLWAATAMLPEAAGFTDTDKGRAALVALDLSTGRVTRTFPVPADDRNHVLGDLLLAPDGTLYLTDSAAPIVWRLEPDAAQLTAFVESPAFGSLQGLALVASGEKLLASDYSNGLVAIDLATRAIQPLAPPANTTLLGLDGLLFDAGELFAVQNGVEPQRVLRLTLSPEADTVLRVATLAAALPDFDDLTLITLVRGRPHIIANSGWALATPTSPPTFTPHTVRVFEIER